MRHIMSVKFRKHIKTEIWYAIFTAAWNDKSKTTHLKPSLY